MVQEFLEEQIKFADKKVSVIREVDKCFCSYDGDMSYHAGIRPYFRVRTKAGGTSELKYLSKTNLSAITALANKKYSHQLLLFYTGATNSLKRILKLFIKIEKAEREYYMNFPIPHESSMLSSRIVADKWANMDYETNTMEGREIVTHKGEKVRSRAEAIIADWLFDNHIPYRYENFLKFKNQDHQVYPDFTVMDPETLKITYIEYFGMMSNEEYVTSTRKKIDLYALNGITIGKNFLPIFEFENCFNSLTISNTLEGYFINNF